MRRAAVVTVLALTVTSCSSGAPRAATPVVTAAPTTTTTAQPAGPNLPTRVADRNGLHYTLTLETPTVPVFGITRVQLRVDNRSEQSFTLGPCALGDIVVQAPSAARPPLSYACGAGTTLSPDGSYTYGARTIAPTAPGNYDVFTQPVAADAPPSALLAPLPLRVVARTTPGPAQLCTQAELDAPGVIPMPAPQFVARHTAIDWIGITGVTIDPPTDAHATKVTAQAAWQSAKRSPYFDSPLGTYQISLGELTAPYPGDDHRLAWLISGDHVPLQPGGPLGVTGPIGVTGSYPACHFQRTGEAIDATTGADLGIATGDFEGP